MRSEKLLQRAWFAFTHKRQPLAWPHVLFVPKRKVDPRLPRSLYAAHRLRNVCVEAVVVMHLTAHTQASLNEVLALWMAAAQHCRLTSLRVDALALEWYAGTAGRAATKKRLSGCVVDVHVAHSAAYAEVLGLLACVEISAQVVERLGLEHTGRAVGLSVDYIHGAVAFPAVSHAVHVRLNECPLAALPSFACLRSLTVAHCNILALPDLGAVEEVTLFRNPLLTSIAGCRRALRVEVLHCPVADVSLLAAATTAVLWNTGVATVAGMTSLRTLTINSEPAGVAGLPHLRRLFVAASAINPLVAARMRGVGVLVRRAPPKHTMYSLRGNYKRWKQRCSRHLVGMHPLPYA